jgi:histone acetyltransferase 1
MQLFILLFIEGGSYVHEDEDAWEFVVLYERRDGVYHFAGYTSVYPFWHYPDQIRLRLRSVTSSLSPPQPPPALTPSQFVILPPYQHAGHGSRLYSALYALCLSRPDVAELTVEDPAEAFEDLRDRCDLRYLSSLGVDNDPLFPLGSPGRQEWADGLRRDSKIAQRQFDRIMEMLLLRGLPKAAGAVREYRLHVKGRLYRFNYVSGAREKDDGCGAHAQEMLSQMTPEERKEALAKTYDSVVEDYERILEMTF